MRHFILAICLALPSVSAFAETPQLEDFPEWSDKFTHCAALYGVLADDIASKADPEDTDKQVKVKAYTDLQKQAGFAAGTYARKSMVGISAGQIEDDFQQYRQYYAGELSAKDENGTRNIREAAADCKKLLPIQQAIAQASRKNAKKKIVVKREGSLTY